MAFFSKTGTSYFTGHWYGLIYTISDKQWRLRSSRFSQAWRSEDILLIWYILMLKISLDPDHNVHLFMIFWSTLIALLWSIYTCICRSLYFGAIADLKHYSIFNICLLCGIHLKVWMRQNLIAQRSPSTKPPNFAVLHPSNFTLEQIGSRWSANM